MMCRLKKYVTFWILGPDDSAESQSKNLISPIATLPVIFCIYQLIIIYEPFFLSPHSLLAAILLPAFAWGIIWFAVERFCSVTSIILIGSLLWVSGIFLVLLPLAIRETA
jgi:hypothetical protein